MERLLKFKFSTATLGEKKANVKREVVFALLSPGSLYISRNIPEALEMIAETPAGSPIVYSYFSRRTRIDIS
jgi:hypothetical protein